MTVESTAKKTAPEKFRAHGVQNDWLSKARGHVVQVSLIDGRVLGGRLLGDDTYCIALDEAGHAESTLVYKHSITSISLNQK